MRKLEVEAWLGLKAECNSCARCCQHSGHFANQASSCAHAKLTCACTLHIIHGQYLFASL